VVRVVAVVVVREVAVRVEVVVVAVVVPGPHWSVVGLK
jgi:hypothetical protein